MRECATPHRDSHYYYLSKSRHLRRSFWVSQCLATKFVISVIEDYFDFTQEQS